MTNDDNQVAIDVGNSAIKVAVAKASDLALGAQLSADEDAIAFQTFPLDLPECERAICDWVKRQAPGGQWCWWVATVNRAASRPLRRAVSETFYDSRMDRQWHSVRHDDIPLRAEVDVPDRIGIDRLLGAYAASLRHRAPLVVVDAGSAVTVDYLGTDRSQAPVFCGGAIFPGIRLQQAALATGTEALRQTIDRNPPEVDRSSPRPIGGKPATNTEQAIRLGVIASVVGGIDRLAAEYTRADRPVQHPGGREPEPRELELHQAGSDRFPAVPALILSGGDGPLISVHLNTKHQLIPHLVCSGLLDLATRQCQLAISGLE